MNARLIIPAQRFSDAKSRLTAHWDAREREALARQLLHHVLDVTRDARDEIERCVLSNDPDVLEFARERGGIPLADREGIVGHGAQLRHAILSTPAELAVIVLMADLPLLEASDLLLLADRARSQRVALAPDRLQLGTNAAVFPSVESRLPQFGNADSFFRHKSAFAGGGFPFDVVQTPGLQLDLDSEEDLRAIEDQSPPASSFSRWLRGTQAKR